jgi:type IV pilus assembly protein PilV
MKRASPQLGRQSGMMLIEALIAILIFSVGILGLVGLQATAVKVSGDAKYRSEAALLANEVIGKMWTSDRTQATLQSAFSSPNGAEYKKWAWAGSAGALQGAPADGTVLRTLPGGIPPTIVIVSGNEPINPTSLVTIKVFWQSPSDNDVQHNFVAQAQIGG